MTYTQPEAVNVQSKPASIKLSEARRRLPFNILSNISWLILSMAVGLWYTPYLIHHLGVAVYGLVPLVTSVTNYFSLITDGFNSAISRFLQIELVKDDTKEANRVFNTAFSGSFFIFILIFPVALAVSWLAPQIFNVPAGHEQDAQLLVLLTMIAFAVNDLTTSFGVSSFANHRFDLRLGVNVVRLLTQVGCVVILFALFSPRVWQIGLTILLSSLVFFFGHILLWGRLTPQLILNPRLFDFPRLKQMFKFGGWLVINSAGAQLFLSIDLIVANLVFGAQTAGRYGAVIIFSSLLRSFVSTISAVFDPIMYTLYAQNDHGRLADYGQLAVKYMGLLIALPIGLICGFSKPLLTVWLGTTFADLSPLVIVLIGHLCVNLAVIPLFSIQEATNNVRLPGILMLIMGLTNAGLAFALAKWSGWGYISIAISGAIVLTAKNALFTPLYAAHILKLPWYTFMRSLIGSVLSVILVGAISFAFASFWDLTSWVKLLMAFALICLLYLPASFFIGLSKAERSFLINEILKRTRR